MQNVGLHWKRKGYWLLKQRIMLKTTLEGLRFPEQTRRCCWTLIRPSWCVLPSSLTFTLSAGASHGLGVRMGPAGLCEGEQERHWSEPTTPSPPPTLRVPRGLERAAGWEDVPGDPAEEWHPRPGPQILLQLQTKHKQCRAAGGVSTRRDTYCFYSWSTLSYSSLTSKNIVVDVCNAKNAK